MGSSIDGEFLELEPLRQPSGKMIYAWAVRGDFDPARLTSNLFSMEWPPKSGRQQEFPEVDRAAWFSIAEARVKILPGQAPLLDAPGRARHDLITTPAPRTARRTSAAVRGCPASASTAPGVERRLDSSAA